MDCVRCGGLWFESGEDSHCILCGNRTMPGHPHCSVGERVTDAEHKRIRTRQLNPMSKRGRPTTAKKTEQLKSLPQDVPLEEHPYILWLAHLWEDQDESIALLNRKQVDLKNEADRFSSSYCEAKATPKI